MQILRPIYNIFTHALYSANYGIVIGGKSR